MVASSKSNKKYHKFFFILNFVYDLDDINICYNFDFLTTQIFFPLNTITVLYDVSRPDICRFTVMPFCVKGQLTDFDEVFPLISRNN